MKGTEITHHQELKPSSSLKKKRTIINIRYIVSPTQLPVIGWEETRKEKQNQNTNNDYLIRRFHCYPPYTINVIAVIGWEV